jgi:hypothetical protein
VTEGKLTLQINQVAGVDFKFTSQQLTLNISQLAERVMRPAWCRSPTTSTWP